MRGTTLVELMVVLLILGLVTGVTSLAIGTLQRTVASERARTLGQARAAAIRLGRPVSVPGPSGAVVRFYPDGRAIGSGIDRFTGELLDAQR
jgi:prepilin-type N-terminal cleavage/methylation domain-containing protein